MNLYRSVKLYTNYIRAISVQLFKNKIVHTDAKSVK